MQVVHGRSERKLILLNELNQPIGPTKEVVSELGSFLGTLARNGTFCPLNVFNWKMLKTHDDMWNYIKVWCSQYFIIWLKIFHFSCADLIGLNCRKNMTFLKLEKIGLWEQLNLLGEGISVGWRKCTFMPMPMMQLEWQKGLNLFQNLHLWKYLNIRILMKLRW